MQKKKTLRICCKLGPKLRPQEGCDDACGCQNNATSLARLK